MFSFLWWMTASHFCSWGKASKIGHEILPRYRGIRIRSCKDPYSPTRIQWKAISGFWTLLTWIGWKFAVSFWISLLNSGRIWLVFISLYSYIAYNMCCVDPILRSWKRWMSISRVDYYHYPENYYHYCQLVGLITNPVGFFGGLSWYITSQVFFSNLVGLTW